MKHAQFKTLVLNRQKICNNVLVSKDKEYSSDTDRLHNFKKAAQMKGCDPIEALDGMMLKHMVSLRDIIDELSSNPHYIPAPHFVTDKFGDVHNYLYLLEALIEDRRWETLGRPEVPETDPNAGHDLRTTVGRPPGHLPTPAPSRAVEDLCDE